MLWRCVKAVSRLDCGQNVQVRGPSMTEKMNFRICSPCELGSYYFIKTWPYVEAYSDFCLLRYGSLLTIKKPLVSVQNFHFSANQPSAWEVWFEQAAWNPEALLCTWSKLCLCRFILPRWAKTLSLTSSLYQTATGWISPLWVQTNKVIINWRLHSTYTVRLKPYVLWKFFCPQYLVIKSVQHEQCTSRNV